MTLAQAFVQRVVLIHGCPTEITSDNATTFSSEFFEEICQILGIQHHFSTPYHSAGNGCCERSFRTYQAMLSKFVNEMHTDWDVMVDFVSFSYNVTPHETTKETPFYLMTGRDPVFPVDVALRTTHYDKPYNYDDIGKFRAGLLRALRAAWILAAHHTAQKAEYMKRSLESERRPEMDVGDLVMLRRSQVPVGLSSKFHLSWKGIFRIIEQEDDLHLWIIPCESPQTKPKRVHINQLKPFYGIPGPACTKTKIDPTSATELTEAGAVDIAEVVGFDHPQPKDSVNTAGKENQRTHPYNLRSRNKVSFIN